MINKPEKIKKWPKFHFCCTKDIVFLVCWKIILDLNKKIVWHFLILNFIKNNSISADLFWRMRANHRKFDFPHLVVKIMKNYNPDFFCLKNFWTFWSKFVKIGFDRGQPNPFSTLIKLRWKFIYKWSQWAQALWIWISSQNTMWMSSNYVSCCFRWSIFGKCRRKV